MKSPKQKIKEMSEGELREYIQTKFVTSGFITVHQWRNFVDYFQIALIKSHEDGKNELRNRDLPFTEALEEVTLQERIRIKALIVKKIKYWARLYRQYGTEQTALVVRVLREILKELEEKQDE